jgi:hypothetical protein
MIDYETLPPPSRRPMLEVDAERVRLTVPPLPQWWEILDISVQFAMGLPLLLPILLEVPIMRAMGPAGATALTVLWKSLLIGLGLAASNTLWVVFRILDFLRYRHVPREIELTAEHLTDRRRGLWGIRYRRLGINQITRIRIHSVKGLTGKIAYKRLTISLGRWRRIFVVFNRKTKDMADDVERAFRQHLCCWRGLPNGCTYLKESEPPP